MDDRTALARDIFRDAVAGRPDLRANDNVGKNVMVEIANDAKRWADAFFDEMNSQANLRHSGKQP